MATETATFVLKELPASVRGAGKERSAASPEKGPLSPDLAGEDEKKVAGFDFYATRILSGQISGPTELQARLVQKLVSGGSNDGKF